MKRITATGTVAGVALALGLAAGPAAAFPAPAGSENPSPAPGTSAGTFTSSGATPGAGTTTLSEAALDDAVQRDLKLTPQQFEAAGELGAQAAAAAVQLRQVPGYAGIRIDGRTIIVTGSGDALGRAVAALAGNTFPMLLEAPAAEPPTAAPAPSPSTAADGSRAQLAVNTEQLFQAYLRDVGPQGLQAVMSAGGKFVIRTGGINTPEALSAVSPAAGADAAGKSTGKVSPEQFVSRYANVELDGGTPLKPEADVPGGIGYQTDIGFVCSTGFSAFDPAGLPTVLTAGHCASDGAAKTATLEFQGVPAGPLGKFGFSQFGGPGNSPVIDPSMPSGPDYTAITDPGNVGTDISVIQSLRQDIDPLPAASTWGDPSAPGPDVKIVGSADPVVGMPVCRSGRSSGWSCGTVDAVGIFLVPGPDYKKNANDIRAFDGFLSYGVQSSGGDSGGPYLSGNYALGTHSAGDTPDANGNVVQNFAVAATLRDSLAVLPGYQLEVFLNKPAITAPAPGETYKPGQVLSGQVPAAPASAVAAGSSVRITIQGKDPFDVPVDAAGKWSFTAPQSADTLRFTAETVNGFSRSGVSSFEFAAATTGPPTPTPSPTPTAPTASNPAPSSPAPAPTTPAPIAPAPADPSPALPTVTPAVVPPPAASPTPSAPPADLANTGGHDDRGAGGLANTGASGLITAAAWAAVALAVGILLMVLVRRRNRRASR
ncbi:MULTISPECIES: S1 family peptidase [unclassified Arthrobacter]|uniref:S1 family peptidase n=1 Tax=unclassified Arthrobacter TaxID=235627 RepID=UPI00039DEF05|nr:MULTISPECIES: S1 family peptidase [unclassified Arthrobacter]